MKFPAVFASLFIGLCIGYGLGWYIHEGSRPEAYGVALIVGILIAVGSSFPIKFWLAVLSEKETAIRTRIKDEESELRYQERQLKLERLRASPISKPKKNGDEFSDDDFDETSKGIILKIVREARKSGIKVTGQGLVGNILKSIH
jgi:hypothetical protein